MGGAEQSLAVSFLFDQSFVFDVTHVSRRKMGRENPRGAQCGFVWLYLARLGACYGCKRHVFDTCLR